MRPAPVGGAGGLRGAGRARSAEPDLGGRDVAGGGRARRRRQRADDGAGGGAARRSLERARSLIDDLFAFAQAGARPVRGASTAVAEVVEGVVEELRAARVGARHHHRRRAAAGRARGGALRERRAGEPAVQPAAQRDQAHGQQPAPAGRRPGRRRATTASASRCEDTGPGLPPELVPQAFDPVRARRRDARAGPGPGAGDRAPPGRRARRPLRRVVAAGRGGAVLVRAARRRRAAAPRDSRPLGAAA